MKATALGFALGQTPFETEIHLQNGMTIPGLQQAICYIYTGDSLVTEQHVTSSLDVIVREAYALAKTWLHKNTEFVAPKFITDGTDGQAADNWTEAGNTGSTVSGTRARNDTSPLNSMRMNKLRNNQTQTQYIKTVAET
ncbi:MAG TPA: hypothetical protein PLD79_06935 [Halothiobacillus sp.]|nr:MAG: hypothetical protein B7Z82_04455 [Halothiobacillus sp. 20-54-6]HQT43718.1 hypothetical protein [Halothiobacillus sp.]